MLAFRWPSSEGRYATLSHNDQFKFSRLSTIQFLLVGCCLLQASATLATPARIAALGGRSDFFTDDANTPRWCAILSDYPQQIQLGAGHFNLAQGYPTVRGNTTSGPSVGIHLTLSQSHDLGTVGLFFNGREAETDPGSLHLSNLKNVFTGIYAHRFGDVTAALSYRRASATYRALTAEILPNPDITSIRTDLGGGLRFVLSPRVLLDLAGEVQGFSQDPFHQDILPHPDATYSWGSYNLRSRSFINLNRRLTVVALATYIRDSVNMLALDTSIPMIANTDRHLVQLGLGLNIFPDPDRMVILSGELLTASDEADPTAPSEITTTPLIDHAEILRLAYETRLSPWLIARAATGWERKTPPAETNLPHNDHFPLAVGVSAAAANITLDLALSNQRPATLSQLALVTKEADTAAWFTINFRYGFRP